VSGGHSGAFLNNEKTEALQFSIALQIARIPSRNNNQPTSASFQSFPIRGSINTASPCPLMPREARAFTPGSRHLFASGAFSRAQLASGAIAACVFFSRDIRGFQDMPRTDRQWVPIIAGRVRFASHVGQNNMRRFANVQKPFARAASE
jgi:hypothetical protein